MLREPRVETGKRTMTYMAASLSIIRGWVAGRLLLMGCPADRGQDANAVLFESMTQGWPKQLGFGFVLGRWVSEAALLVIAAQAGFVGGPQVLANTGAGPLVPPRFAT